MITIVAIILERGIISIWPRGRERDRRAANINSNNNNQNKQTASNKTK